jgi:hypothetical protein
VGAAWARGSNPNPRRKHCRVRSWEVPGTPGEVCSFGCRVRSRRCRVRSMGCRVRTVGSATLLLAWNLDLREGG